MRRTILAILLLVAGAAGVLFYYAAAREREYRRLIAQGQTALAEDRTFAAIEAFSGAIALKDDSMLAYLKRGETYRQRGDLTSAVRDLRTAARLDPTATRPLEQLGDLNLGRQWHGRAAELYQNYLKLDDQSPRILYKLGLARYQEGNLDAAVVAVREALRLDDRMAEAHYLLGLCLEARGRSDAAVTALQAAVRLAPSMTSAREELVDLYRETGRHREAIEQLDALRGLEPTQTERHVALGLEYATIGRTDLAVATLSAATERFPDKTVLYEALGRVWLQVAETRDDPAALRKALEALATAVGPPEATSQGLALYGRALLLSGRPEDAERALLESTSKFPLAPTAFASLATTAQRLGHFQIARESWLRYASLSGDPAGTTVALRVADLSMQLDEPGLAAEWYSAALADGRPPDASLLGRLADAQFKSGQRERALDTVTRALDLEPHDRDLIALRRRLQ